MDIQKLFGNKHPKLLKAQRELEIYDQEQEEWKTYLAHECRDCEQCDSLAEHMRVCRNGE